MGVALAVEDVALNAASAQAALDGAGHGMVLAGDGASALEMVRRPLPEWSCGMCRWDVR